MEGGNHGPYAKLLPLRNGHYKRIVDPVVPEFFVKFNACCGDGVNSGEIEFARSQSFGYSGSELTSQKSGDSKVFNTGMSSKVFDRAYTGSLDFAASGLEDRSTSSEDSQSEESVEDYYDTREIREERSIVKRASQAAGDEYMNSVDSRFETKFGSGYEDEGVPMLFYTKTREKPALLIMTVDPDMQVIYMKRNKVCRFFPIKLIDRFITSPERIEAEFSKQIQRDPTIRIANMVMFNASNFTDSVAIQFANQQDRNNFMREVNQIKKIIENKF